MLALSSPKLGETLVFQWVRVWGWDGWPCLLNQPVTPPFPSLLQTLSTQFKQALEQTQDKQPWTHRLVEFADVLLNHSRNVSPLTPFTTQQRQAWTR